jgi:hypothetical protein
VHVTHCGSVLPVSTSKRGGIDQDDKSAYILDWMRRIIGGVALVVVVAGCVIFATHDRGPFYDGKDLGFWLDSCEASERDRVTEAERAIREMGLRAVPRLSKDITRFDSRLKRNLLAFIEDHSWIRPSSDHDRQRLAVNGFRVLGPSATSAIPILHQALVGSTLRDEHSYNMIALGLAGIGSNAVPALASGITHNNPSVRVAALYGLLDCGCGLELVVQSVLATLKDPDEDVRKMAILLLGSATNHPDVVFSAIADVYLRDPSPSVQQSAKRALLHSGEEAIPWILKGAFFALRVNRALLPCTKAFGMLRGETENYPLHLQSLTSW